MALPPYPPPSAEPDEFFCLTCGRFSHSDEAVVRAHYQQCSDKRIWGCKACNQEFLDYREAEEHVWEHWRAIEDANKRRREDEDVRRRQDDEVIRRDMQERAQALLRESARQRSG